METKPPNGLGSQSSKLTRRLAVAIALVRGQRLFTTFLTADHRSQAADRANYRLHQPFSGDLHRYAFGNRIKNRRILLYDHAKFLQLLVRNVRLDSELHANFLVAVSNVLVDAEESAEVDIAVNRRLDFFNRDTPGRGMISHRGRDAGRQGMQEVLSWVWALVRSEQNRRFVGIHFEFDGVFKVGAGPKERVNGRPGVCTIQPLVANLECEFGKSRCGFDQVNRPKQLVAIDAIN